MQCYFQQQYVLIKPWRQHTSQNWTCVVLMSHLSCPLWFLSRLFGSLLDRKKKWSEERLKQQWEFSEVIKGSSKGPFWVQKIKTMPISHLPQSPSYLMWLLSGLVVQNQHFSLQQITNGETHTLNMFWWEWLSLEDKLKDWIVAAQSGFKIHPADDWEPEKILWGGIKRMQMRKVFRFWQKAFAIECIQSLQRNETQKNNVLK